MSRNVWKRGVLLVVSVAVLGVNAGALLGWGEKKTAGTDTIRAVDTACVTYQNVSCQGQLHCSGGEGTVTFSLVKAPGKGTVTLEGDRFYYTPKAGAAGTDRFTYTAADEKGNVSFPATVEIRMQKVRSGVHYADMDSSTAAVAAQHLAEADVFVGVKLGEQYYFEPDREVLRSEFLAMALEAVERKVTAVTMTGFCDDGVIPTWAKAYAAAGVAEGVVTGSVTAEGNAFRGEDPITRSEAATILNRVLGLENVDLRTWYAEGEMGSSWAAQAIANLESAQVLEAGSFGSGFEEMPVHRAEAAEMLSAARTLAVGDGPGRALYGQ